jgi:hypothetical protein
VTNYLERKEFMKDALKFLTMENKQNDCPRGCHRYNKNVDKIAEAAAKHRSAVVSLKEIAENLRTKERRKVFFAISG